jgi:tRNA-specific 2-thiouridylase
MTLNMAQIKTEYQGGLNSLGIDKTPADTRVVVAMSGGVDSSVVAALLKDQGYDVVGITLQLYDHGVAVEKKGACCAGQDIHDARKVAQAIDIPHYVLDYEDRFKDSVIEDFADSYIRGETPIPCVRCNQEVKFKDLLETAKDLDADILATGHYVKQVFKADGSSELHSADYMGKDQSYFLFATTQAQLDYLRFPLGGMPKEETRELAAHYGLLVAAKPDSQDICFVPTGGYATVIEKIRPGAAVAGDIIHIDGRVLGRHNGIINYTIGQRKGLGIGGGGALYVVKLDPENNRVLVGPRDALFVSKIHLKEMNWLGDSAIPEEGLKISAKVRSTRPPAGITLYPDTAPDTAYFILDEADMGISAGQAAVLYDGTRVLGGGWITMTVSDWQEK